MIMDVREEWRQIRTGQRKEYNIKTAPLWGEEFKGHC